MAAIKFVLGERKRIDQLLKRQAEEAEAKAQAEAAAPAPAARRRPSPARFRGRGGKTPSCFVRLKALRAKAAADKS